MRNGGGGGGAALGRVKSGHYLGYGGVVGLNEKVPERVPTDFPSPVAMHSSVFIHRLSKSSSLLSLFESLHSLSAQIPHRNFMDSSNLSKAKLIYMLLLFQMEHTRSGPS